MSPTAEDFHEDELALARQRSLGLAETAISWVCQYGTCRVTVTQPPRERHITGPSDPALADRPKRPRKRLP